MERVSGPYDNAIPTKRLASTVWLANGRLRSVTDQGYTSTATSEALLRAARAEFAAHGLSGGRVNRIAATAKINKERIYGYFGNKEHLFEIVVSQALDELVAAVPLTRNDDLVEHVLATFDYHHRNPDLLRLLMWESLHYSTQSAPFSEARLSLYRAKVASLAAIQGREPQERDALVLFALTGLAAWPNAMTQLGATIAGQPVTSAASQATMGEIVTAMVRGLVSAN